MCAPTGIAATHVNGTTIHSATGIGVPKCQEDFRRMHQGFRKELWTKLVEVLIIDEISMLSGEWLDNLERMLRELTHYYGRGEFQQYLRMPMKDIPAFGGIQVVVVGDFYQLPPIPVRLSARINWSARRRDSLVDLRAGGDAVPVRVSWRGLASA